MPESVASACSSCISPLKGEILPARDEADLDASKWELVGTVWAFRDSFICFDGEGG